MSDPDLRSDETVLVRTEGVYVKSIPFEGIITNKRIVLVDRAKNLLPPKEIPLATIKDVDGGENAIRDPFVTVTVITRTGETRQMILTFSRTAGGNRNKERDEWVQTLKENVSSSFEQVIRKGTPGFDQPHKRPESIASPRIEVIGASAQPAASRPLQKKEMDTLQPIKKSIENAPSKIQTAVKESDIPSPGYGTFCSRCGNKVPEGSGFCNRCGSSIIPPGSTAPVATSVPDYRAQAQRPIERENQTIEPLIERSPVTVPAEALISETLTPPVQKTTKRAQSPLYDNPPEHVAAAETVPAVTAPKPAKTPPTPRLFSPKELAPTPLNPASMPTAASPPPKKPRRTLQMPGKKVFMVIGVIILLIVVALIGVIFVYPMISGMGSSTPGSAAGVPVTTSIPVTTSTPVPSGPVVIPQPTEAPAVPATGVYARISYIGGWKGTYGMPAALQSVTDSGDRFFVIENATGPVQVNAEKTDGSTRHELVVEIYRNGGLLATGKTSEGFGKVTVSADATTGIAQATKAVTVTGTPTTNPLTNVTTVNTTAPVTNTTPS